MLGDYPVATTTKLCLSSRLSDGMLDRNAQRPVAFAFVAHGVAVMSEG